MNLTKNGITIVVDDAEIVRMVLDRLNGSEYPDTLRGIAVPRIGEFWCGQGGVYVGIMRGRNGEPDYHLISGPEFDGDITWDPAMEWAKSLTIDDCKDFTLPWLAEQSVSRGNVPELFKPRAYWSCEQHASDSYKAWGQYFLNGSQDYWTKSLKLRARLVRRILIGEPT